MYYTSPTTTTPPPPPPPIIFWGSRFKHIEGSALFARRSRGGGSAARDTMGSCPKCGSRISSRWRPEWGGGTTGAGTHQGGSHPWLGHSEGHGGDNQGQGAVVGHSGPLRGGCGLGPQGIPGLGTPSTDTTRTTRNRYPSHGMYARRHMQMEDRLHWAPLPADHYPTGTRQPALRLGVHGPVITMV